MKQFWLQIAALFVVIITSFLFVANPTLLDSILPPKKSTNSLQPITPSAPQQVVVTTSNGSSKAQIKVEIADTDQKRELGLGGRNSLDINSGMLFILDKPKIAQFWMKGMKIPLDFIWIRGDMVVETTENIQPPQGTPNEVLPIYSPTVEVDKVLEVNAGFVKAHGIQSGDKLKQAQ